MSLMDTNYLPGEHELYDYIARHDSRELRAVQRFIGEMTRFQSYEDWANTIFGKFDGSRFYQALIHNREGLRVFAKRYALLQRSIDEGILDRENVQGVVADIGCDIDGASSDALAMFGGTVYPIDEKKVNHCTMSGRPIIESGGRDFVAHYSRWAERGWEHAAGPELTLVTCFGIDSIDKELSFAERLCDTALEQIAEGGQLLMTFRVGANYQAMKHRIGEKFHFLSKRGDGRIPWSHSASDKYLYIVRNPTGQEITDKLDPASLARSIAKNRT